MENIRTSAWRSWSLRFAPAAPYLRIIHSALLLIFLLLLDPFQLPGTFVHFKYLLLVRPGVFILAMAHFGASCIYLASLRKYINISQCADNFLGMLDGVVLLGAAPFIPTLAFASLFLLGMTLRLTSTAWAGTLIIPLSAIAIVLGSLCNFAIFTKRALSNRSVANPCFKYGFSCFVCVLCVAGAVNVGILKWIDFNVAAIANSDLDASQRAVRSLKSHPFIVPDKYIWLAVQSSPDDLARQRLEDGFKSIFNYDIKYTDYK
ncbi:MAG: hypothetical protein HY286_07565 [Planctomycetes bacterium]|nr:hypothetical protein [Planctomycetota bacterium]